MEFIAYGKDLSELFSNASMALFDTIADIKAIRAGIESGIDKPKSVSVSEKAYNERDLLWYVLQSILSKADSSLVYCYEVASAEVDAGSGKTMHAKFRFLCVPQKQEYSRIYAKGVSGYDLHISNAKGMYKASVVVDI